jgi:hypothetical protein
MNDKDWMSVYHFHVDRIFNLLKSLKSEYQDDQHVLIGDDFDHSAITRLEKEEEEEGKEKEKEKEKETKNKDKSSSSSSSSSSNKEAEFLQARKQGQLPFCSFQNGAPLTYFRHPTLGHMTINTYEKSMFVFSYFFTKGEKQAASLWLRLANLMPDAPDVNST